MLKLAVLKGTNKQVKIASGIREDLVSLLHQGVVKEVEERGIKAVRRFKDYRILGYFGTHEEQPFKLFKATLDFLAHLETETNPQYFYDRVQWTKKEDDFTHEEIWYEYNVILDIMQPQTNTQYSAIVDHAKEMDKLVRKVQHDRKILINRLRKQGLGADKIQVKVDNEYPLNANLHAFTWRDKCNNSHPSRYYFSILNAVNKHTIGKTKYEKEVLFSRFVRDHKALGYLPSIEDAHAPVAMTDEENAFWDAN